MSGVPGWLDRRLTNIALCWRLVRADGLALGFTSHDRDLRVDGLLYRAGPGMTPSSVSQYAELEPDSMEVEGVLDDRSIRAFDLDAGRWLNARIELFACDWTAPDTPLTLVRGELGQVSRSLAQRGGSYRIDLRSGAYALDLVPPMELSPTCRARLGDGRCGVDMAGRTRRVVAAGASGGDLQLQVAPADAANLAGGRVRVLDGVLAGLDFGIVDVSGPLVHLDEPLPAALEPGTRVRLSEGCDKRFATCRDRFANAEAFDGEPFVPGADTLVRYVDP